MSVPPHLNNIPGHKQLHTEVKIFILDHLSSRAAQTIRPETATEATDLAYRRIWQQGASGASRARVA